MKNKKTPYHHLFRVLHWVLGVSTVVLIVTGLGLHAVARPGWSLFGRFQAWIPAGRILFVHMVASLFFTPVVILSTVLFIKRFQPKKHHFKQIRWGVNYLLIFASLLTLVTSFGLLYNVSAPAYQVSRFVHAVAGLVLLPLAFVIHVVRFRALVDCALLVHVNLDVVVFGTCKGIPHCDGERLGDDHSATTGLNDFDALVTNEVVPIEYLHVHVPGTDLSGVLDRERNLYGLTDLCLVRIDRSFDREFRDGDCFGFYFASMPLGDLELF